jgi:hypothetical protein
MGKINYLEVHNLAQLEQDLPAISLSSEDRKEVAAKFKRTSTT